MPLSETLQRFCDRAPSVAGAGRLQPPFGGRNRDIIGFFVVMEMSCISENILAV